MKCCLIAVLAIALVLAATSEAGYVQPNAGGGNKGYGGSGGNKGYGGSGGNKGYGGNGGNNGYGGNKGGLPKYG